METAFEKNLPPDIRVIPALNDIKTERSNMLGCLVVGGLFISFLAYLVWINAMPNNIWYWLTALVLLAVLFLLLYTTRQALTRIRLRQKLDREGIRIQAIVVGHNIVEYEDNPNIYIVYYQFQPDFIVKYTDLSPDRRFFDIPVGGKLSVRYWTKNPEINGVITS
jgi:hypothetical protein